MGIRSLLPLDCKAGIDEALSYPIDGTEMDVQMTRDSVLVAFHDEDLESNTECSGPIHERTFEELHDCHNQGWFTSEPISSLEEILKDRPQGTTFSLDLKAESDNAKFLNSYTDKLMRLTNRFPQYTFLMESNNESLLNSLKEKGAKADLYFYAQNLETGIKTVLKNGFKGVSIDLKAVDQPVHGVIKGQGVRIMLWGCGSAISNRKAVELQPDIIQTDDIPSMCRILRR